MAESELFERGLQARRDVLGAEYVDAARRVGHLREGALATGVSVEEIQETDPRHRVLGHASRAPGVPSRDMTADGCGLPAVVARTWHGAVPKDPAAAREGRWQLLRLGKRLGWLLHSLVLHSKCRSRLPDLATMKLYPDHGHPNGQTGTPWFQMR
jgi:hypothetical protein